MQRHGLTSGIFSKQKKLHTHRVHTAWFRLRETLYLEKLNYGQNTTVVASGVAGIWLRRDRRELSEEMEIFILTGLWICALQCILYFYWISQKKSIKISKETVRVGRYGWTRRVGSWQLLKLRNGHVMYIHSAVYVLHKNIFQMWKGIIQQAILEWVAFPFSKGSSQPRDQTQISHIAGRFFTRWVTREA